MTAASSTSGRSVTGRGPGAGTGASALVEKGFFYGQAVLAGAQDIAGEGYTGRHSWRAASRPAALTFSNSKVTTVDRRGRSRAGPARDRHRRRTVSGR